MADYIDRVLQESGVSSQVYFELIEKELEDIERELLLQIKNYEAISTGHLRLVEEKIVFEKTRQYALPAEMLDVSSQFTKIAGVIHKKDIERFKRMVFRASRGNALSMFAEIEEPLKDPVTEEAVEKVVFYIVIRGDMEGALGSKLLKICDSFGAVKVFIPNSINEIEEMYEQKIREIHDNEQVLQETHQRINTMLRRLAAPRTETSRCSLIEEYRLFVSKEKSIYNTLNMFTAHQNVFYGQCWCPISRENDVFAVLNAIARDNIEISGGQLQRTQVPPKTMPPTFFNLNDFTSPFQDIVDTYGVPTYQEANPALLTCFTFPFLFGVMFGDIGHGTMLFLFSSYLCLYRDKIHKENGMFKPLLFARYLLLMMGFCAMYCGFIYNDCFGIPLNMFGTRWEKKEENDQYTRDSVYPFGVDPKWYIADNELVFMNSLKMKLSVILGVIQMVVGILFKGANAIYFKKPLDFFFEFIPQLIFMLCIFGYMIVMIFVKWSTDFNYNWGDDAPNLITVLMNMFLKVGSLDGETSIMGGVSAQESVQLTLILIALLCVPVMLLVKPLILKNRHKKGNHLRDHGVNIQLAYLHQQNEGEHDLIPEEEEFNFGEIMIHQMIETIEFVLGSISNTASYLRLWALSLAHAQLAKVFFDKCIVGTIETGNPVLVVVGFFVFANVTIGVLMCMDVLECFLHALRLHWVEFMNKFFKGEGNKFAPFTFRPIFLEPKSY